VTCHLRLQLPELPLQLRDPGFPERRRELHRPWTKLGSFWPRLDSTVPRDLGTTTHPEVAATRKHQSRSIEAQNPQAESKSRTSRPLRDCRILHQLHRFQLPEAHLADRHRHRRHLHPLQPHQPHQPRQLPALERSCLQKAHPEHGRTSRFLETPAATVGSVNVASLTILPPHHLSLAEDAGTKSPQAAPDTCRSLRQCRNPSRRGHHHPDVHLNRMLGTAGIRNTGMVTMHVTIIGTFQTVDTMIGTRHAHAARRSPRMKVATNGWMYPSPLVFSTLCLHLHKFRKDAAAKDSQKVCLARKHSIRAGGFVMFATKTSGIRRSMTAMSQMNIYPVQRKVVIFLVQSMSWPCTSSSMSRQQTARV